MRLQQEAELNTHAEFIGYLEVWAESKIHLTIKQEGYAKTKRNSQKKKSPERDRAWHREAATGAHSRASSVKHPGYQSKTGQSLN